MTEILALLQNIAPVVSATILQQMSHVIYGMLISNGRITMLEISRWTESRRQLPNHPTAVSYAHALAANPVDLLYQPVTKTKS